MDTCSGCGGDSRSVSHQCDICGRRNHAVCGVVIVEGYGGTTRCTTCASAPTPTKKKPTRTSSSPIVAAFARTAQRAASEAETKEEQAAPAVSEPASRPPAELATTRKRKKQHVTSVADRVQVVKRMRELKSQGVKHFKSAVVAEFPGIFTGNMVNDREQARVWWEQKDKLDPLDSKPSPLKSISVVLKKGVKRVNIKVIGTRGRKREKWVQCIYPRILDEFARLRSMGVKMGYPMVQAIACHELKNSDSEWNENTVVKGVPLKKKITTRWIQRFCDCNNIVFRCVSGKLSVSPEKEASIEQAIAFHLGELKRQFDAGELIDDTVFNMDETHFIINVDDGRTLDFGGAEKVKYHDVVSGGEGMTLVVMLRGGSRARVMTPMMIFTNPKSSYPISTVQPVPGIAYRSSPKGWMNRRIFCEWLSDKKCVTVDTRRRNQTIFMDNVAGHKAIPNIENEVERTRMDNVLATKRVALRFLPANSTHLCQPADAMIIQKLKQVWKIEWEAKKMELAEALCFSNRPNKKGEWSGKLCQPGKQFFLKLAVEYCREVSAMKDENGFVNQ